MKIKRNDIQTKRKTFEFPIDDILNHLETKDNQTQYLRKLIKKDMLNESNINEDTIVKIIEQYLANNNIQSTGFDTIETDITNSIFSVIGEEDDDED